jgi:hypothetical protein
MVESPRLVRQKERREWDVFIFSRPKRVSAPLQCAFFFSSAFKVGFGTDVSCTYIQLQVSEMNHTCKRCESAMKDTQVRVYRSMTWMTTNKAKACAKKGNHNVRCDSFKAEIWPA